jgi:hypothetical protein
MWGDVKVHADATWIHRMYGRRSISNRTLLSPNTKLMPWT